MPILGIIASSITGNLLLPGSYESIATTTVGSGGAADVTFSSIPATYTHLQIRGISRNASATDTISIRFNSDTGSNYTWHQLRGNGSVTAGTSSSPSVTFMEIPYTSYSGTTANVFAGAVIDVLDYANTNKYKTVRGLGGADQNGSGSIFFTSGLWQSSSAITTIRLFPSSGNLAEYTQYALYGIKGA
jgi:hypothetical protein